MSGGARRTDPVLEIHDLVIEAAGRRGHSRLVDGVSLSVAPGEVLGLIGESGAGKSTIGLAALGYVRDGCRILSGTIRLNGEDLATASETRRRRFRGSRIAYVAQSAAAALNPRVTVMDQCIEIPVRGGMSARAARAGATELFRKLGLPTPESIGDRFPHELSGGQLQRIVIAMAMLPKPEIVVFDEPTTALDVTTQVDVLVEIRALIREVGCAAIYISHDLAVVMQLADTMMVLRHGRTVEVGPTSQLATTPQTAYARALLNVQRFDKAEIAPASVRSPLLAARSIEARYGSTTVLSGIDFEIRKGETLAVVGESGSGKSTLAKVLSGLMPPASGSLLWNGEALSPELRNRSWPQVRHLQLIHQMPDTALNMRHTVRQVVDRPLQRFGGYSATERDRRVEELLRLVELDAAALIDRPTTALSGGQKQRLCIARALAAEPELIICDEVTSALDPLVADGILKLLDRLKVERGIAYLFITHDLGIVRAIADQVMVLQKGRLVESGPTREIFEPPYEAYTARLIRATPEKRIGWLDEHLAGRADL